MDINISAALHISWLIAVLAVQTGVDIYFTRTTLLLPLSRRIIILATSSAVAMIAVVLLIRLMYPFIAASLQYSRDEGQNIGIAVLGLIILYLLFCGVFILIRSSLVYFLGMENHSKEKRQEWSGYVWVGSVVTVLTAAPVYLVSILLPALVATLRI